MHIDEKKRYDKRTIEQNLKEGLISQEEYEAYLANLPDVLDKIFVRGKERKKKKSSS